jgi:hypothetical protein
MYIPRKTPSRSIAIGIILFGIFLFVNPAGAYTLFATFAFANTHLAPRVGFEPTTNRLTADRSTTELPGILFIWHFFVRKSGREDSNLRPPGPKPGALPS